MTDDIVREKDGTFAKGHSGNPSGKPKAYMEVVKLARENTVEVLQRLTSIALESSDHNAAIKACTVILERGWGKVPDKIEISDTHSMSKDELIGYARKMVKEIDALEAIEEVIQ